MDHYWLITWTCYGHWLPGDVRGFVGNVRDDDGGQVIHNIPGTPYDQDLPRLESWVRSQMKGAPITLELAEAQAMIEQFQETAQIRKWNLEAASVMDNHTHLVVGGRNSDPSSILGTFKSWATRAVKKTRELPPNGTFWTAKGSKRRLTDKKALHDAVIYVVKKQPNPLVIWYDPRWKETFNAFDQGDESRARQDNP